jgi:hypothetical protein
VRAAVKHKRASVSSACEFQFAWKKNWSLNSQVKTIQQAIHT